MIGRAAQAIAVVGLVGIWASVPVERRPGRDVDPWPDCDERTKESWGSGRSLNPVSAHHVVAGLRRLDGGRAGQHRKICGVSGGGMAW